MARRSRRSSGRVSIHNPVDVPPMAGTTPTETTEGGGPAAPRGRPGEE